MTTCRPSASTALALCALAALTGCPIEPPSPTPVTIPDAGTIVGRDATTSADAGPLACDLVSPCPAGLSCSRDGLCVRAAAACSDNGDCAEPELCTHGMCAVPTGACTPGGDTCGPDARCFASGWCGPAATSAADADALTATCRFSADCGHTGRCSFGVCAPCDDDADCPGARVCSFDGTCAEPATCTANSDCFTGNECTNRVCAPVTRACRADPGNDTTAGASPLTEGATTTPTLCGEDVDWWRFSLAAGIGARVVVRTDPRVNGAAVSLTGTDDEVSSLDLPGLTVLEVASATAARELRLRVATLDTSGPYTVALSRVRDLCAGDLLDLYGDARVEDAIVLGAGARIERRACPRDVDISKVAVGAGDRWSISPRLLEDGALGVEVGRLDGAVTTTVAARGRFIRGTTTALTPTPAAGPETWAISMTTENVPQGGAAYTIAVDRVRGPRLAECAAAQAVGAGVTTLALAAELDGPVDCTPAAPRVSLDRVVRIDSPRVGALLRATARPTSTTARARVGLALLETCADDTSATSCDFTPEPNGGASIERVLGGTPVWAVVSSTTAVDVALTVAFDERGDYTCRLPGATPILASGEWVVDTRAATNTVEATFAACSLDAGDGAGPDRFFALDVGAVDRAVLELEGDSGGLLWVSTDCARMSGTCLGSAASAPGAPARVVLPAPGRAQTYLIAVDGLAASDAGTWILRSRLRPQCVADSECMAPERCDDYACVGPPANDRCDGALVTLTNGRAIIQGSTGAASDDFSSPRCTSPNSAQDVVYAVDVPAGTTELRARVTRASWDPIVAIRNTCATSTAELACDDDSGEGLLPDARVQMPAAGRYFVIVDGYAGGGPFTLELTTR